MGFLTSTTGVTTWGATVDTTGTMGVGVGPEGVTFTIVGVAVVTGVTMAGLGLLSKLKWNS